MQPNERLAIPGLGRVAGLCNSITWICQHDVRNYSEYKSRFQQHLKKVFRLGLFQRKPELTIADPCRLAEAATARVVEEIADAVLNLVRWMENRQGSIS